MPAATHRMTGTPLYHVWKAMRQRCQNRRYKEWHLYGGRGIKVCRRWDDFLEFYQWAMSSGYRSGLELDRKRNNGSYCPSNCRWTTRSVQCQNRRKMFGKSSRYLGVCWHKSSRRWVATVKLKGKSKHLGLFLSEHEAAVVRDAYVKQHYDPFAMRNVR
jgi:hypothetical protein